MWGRTWQRSGINRLSQDTSACLLAGGRLVAVAEDERF
jgi:hypothetical protein